MRGCPALRGVRQRGWPALAGLWCGARHQEHGIQRSGRLQGEQLQQQSIDPCLRFTLLAVRCCDAVIDVGTRALVLAGSSLYARCLHLWRSRSAETFWCAKGRHWSGKRLHACAVRAQALHQPRLNPGLLGLGEQPNTQRCSLFGYP